VSPFCFRIGSRRGYELVEIPGSFILPPGCEFKERPPISNPRWRRLSFDVFQTICPKIQT
jgi:hypothetical protein